MFKNLQENVKSLNADVKNVVNCEKAKRLKKKLLSIGLPLAIGGFLGVFVCFALFAVAGFRGNIDRILLPFLLIIPCGIIGGIGAIISSLGFRIIITDYTTSLIDETVGNHCPNCGEATNHTMQFCPKCGSRIKKECANCKHVNNHQNEYCEKCGTKLD